MKVKLYEQIEDILSLAADFHSRLARFYDRLTDEVEKERVAMLLDYLSRHERRLHEGLERYGEEQQEKLGETWLQYAAEDEPLSMDNLDASPDMTVDDLVEMVMELDNRLLTFYRAMIGSAAIPPEVRDMFSRLAEQQEQEKAKLARTAEQIKKT